jgi:gluconokinase
MKMAHIIGIDIGTTNVKALVVNTLGDVVFQTSVPVETLRPENGLAEQSPDALWQLVQNALKTVAKRLPEKPLAVAFSAAMHSIMAVDKQGKPLTNALIWADNRAEKQAEDVKKMDIGQAIFNATGTPIHPLSPLLKLMWLRENEPEIFNETDWFCSIKEFIFHKLFGKKIIDMSIASATGLMETATCEWHKPSLELAKINENKLSKIVSPYHIELLKSNNFLPEWENVPFVIGASDGTLSSLAAGAMAENLTTITIGTSGAVRRISKNRPLSINAEKPSKLFTYRLDETYFVVGGATNNGGIALEWLSKKVLQNDVNGLINLAKTVKIGSEGLVFIPFILGERALIWEANARGAFVNVGFEHTQAHFIRATLEGILFNLQHIHAAIERELSPSSAIFADGGFVQSPMWVQMLADITQKPVHTRVGADGGSLGAIMMAMKAIGLSADWLETTKILTPTTVVLPSENASDYRVFYDRYVALINN